MIPLVNRVLPKFLVYKHYKGYGRVWDILKQLENNPEYEQLEQRFHAEIIN
jgi:hypothetical protein